MFIPLFYKIVDLNKICHNILKHAEKFKIYLHFYEFRMRYFVLDIYNQWDIKL